MELKSNPLVVWLTTILIVAAPLKAASQDELSFSFLKAQSYLGVREIPAANDLWLGLFHVEDDNLARLTSISVDTVISGESCRTRTSVAADDAHTPRPTLAY